MKPESYEPFMSHYSKEAEEYWNGEAIRFLGEGDSIPSLEQRVKGAFDAGVKSVHRNNWFNAFAKLKVVGSDNCNIYFEGK